MLILFINFFILISLIDSSPSAIDGTALTFEVEDNDKMCFYEYFKHTKNYIWTFKVISGGNHDIDATVESPNGKILYKKTKKRQDQFDFESTWGVYTFCFSNEFSTVTHKTIYMELRPAELESLAEEGGKKKISSANTLIEDRLESIHSANSQIVEEQVHYKLNEAEGRHSAERLNMMVQIYAFGQAIGILITGLGQVLILKTFFQDGRPSSAYMKT
ncbi:unnamed protein product [Dimorphilus gyrociliatus]|uniref:GOLD domain-containing protein n=1 Tax=Dimorphilus gyrociliatus TaxID=2664684 RepID=A0A7I8VBZ1_9ANNE|nr:unnamed protein product [Dimorphilus gyrociliatus]